MPALTQRPCLYGKCSTPESIAIIDNSTHVASVTAVRLVHDAGRRRVHTARRGPSPSPSDSGRTSCVRTWMTLVPVALLVARRAEKSRSLVHVHDELHDALSGSSISSERQAA